MKIKGLKQAVGDYKRANAGGWYSPIYGKLMFDKADGEIWTDQFCSLGHNEWKVYHSDTIINLGAMMAEEDVPVTREKKNGYTMESFGAYSGLKQLLKSVQRKSAKAEAEAEKQAELLIDAMASFVCDKNGIELL